MKNLSFRGFTKRGRDFWFGEEQDFARSPARSVTALRLVQRVVLMGRSFARF
jgi:hypothetical protein